MCALFDSILLIGDDFVGVEDFVDDFVQRFLTRKVLVIELGITSREDSAEVLHPCEFMNRLGNNLPKAQLRASFHCISNFQILIFVLR